MSGSERAGWSTWPWLLVAVVSFLIATLATDSDGRKSYDHAKPLPAAVVELSPSSYLVKNGSDVDLSYVCLREPGGSDDQRIKTTRVLPQLSATFVECGTGQTWNDHRKLSLSFFGAAVYVLTSPKWFIPIFGLLFLPWLLWVIPGYAIDRRRAVAKAKQHAIDTEAKRSALAAAFAKGEIEEPEFERGLDRVMRGLQ